MSEVPVFGDRKAGVVYVPRRVASAIIFEQGRLAVVHVRREGDNRFFLPGGGIDEGETAEQALLREIVEECGRAAVVEGKLGEAVQHTRGPEGAWSHHIAYFRARFGAVLGPPLEADHTLMWLTASEAAARLYRRSDAWAVSEFWP
jgi:8-oxo-dGTP diphosphatase